MGDTVLARFNMVIVSFFDSSNEDGAAFLFVPVMGRK